MNEAKMVRWLPDSIRRILPVGFAVALVLAACGGGQDSVATSGTATPATTAAQTTRAPVAMRTAQDVVQSIEALAASPRVTFSVVTTYRTDSNELATAAEGTLDQEAKAIEFTLGLGASSPAVLAGLPGVESVGVIYSDDRGVLIEFAGRWLQIEPDQFEQFYDQALGFAIPDEALTIPFVGLVFERILLDPAQLVGLESTTATRTIDGIETPGFRFAVPGTWVAPALVPTDLVAVAAQAPVADVQVEVNWWLDPAGRVRVVEINGDSIIGEVLEELDGAFPDSDMGLFSSNIEGVSLSLNVADADSAAAIAYPRPSKVEVVDMTEELARGLVGPGTCVATYEAALLPAGESILDCAEPHRGEVFAVFDIPDGEVYPGEDPVFKYGETLCTDQSLGYTDEDLEVFVLYPTDETWSFGDRRVLCVFDLGAPRQGSVARVPVDRVGSLLLEIGHCLPIDADMNLTPVPIVDCAELHAFEVIAVEFIGTWDRSFPGDGPVRSEAIELCSQTLDELDPEGLFDSFYYSPTRESWDFGDRIVTCIAESTQEVSGSLIAG